MPNRLALSIAPSIASPCPPIGTSPESDAWCESKPVPSECDERLHGDALIARPDTRRRRESSGVPMTPRSKASFAIARALGVVVVTVRGILDAADCVRLEGTLRDLIDNQGNLAVMVDLQELIGLAPGGLDVFRRAAAWAAVHGGELL